MSVRQNVFMSDCERMTDSRLDVWADDSVVSHAVTRLKLMSPSALTPPRWPSGKASASRAEDPGFESRLRRDISEVESYQ